MENKKVAIILSVVAALLFIVVAFVFLYKPARTSITDMVKKEKEVNVVMCDYKNDDDVYAKAMDDGDVSVCSCMEDENYLNICIEAAFEQSVYLQALEQVNAELCNEIESEEIKKACINVANSKMDYLVEQNKQELIDTYVISHNTDKSIEELEKITEGAGVDIQNLISLVLSYAEKGLEEQEQGDSQVMYVNKALEVVEKAKKIDNNNSEVYRVEGYVYEIQPDLIKAIESYNKAIEIDQTNALAYAGRGHVNRIIGILDLAVEDFQRAAELDEENQQIFIYTNLCNLESSRSNNEEAIKNCTIVTRSESRDPIFKSEAYQLMAGIYISEKKYNEAASHLEQAKALTPNDANLFVEIARLNIYQENYKVAGDNAKKATVLSPGKAGAYLMFSQSLYMEEKFDDSIAVAEKGLSLVQDDVSLLFSNKIPTQRDLYYSIANNYRELGNTEMQKEYIKKATDLDNIQAHE